MENLITRHRNVSILVAVLFAQVLGLAVQVKRSSSTEETRLIRVWAVSAVIPFEKALVWMQDSTSGLWHDYVYLRGVRAENRELKQQIEEMRLEQVRLSDNAGQARRLQALLGFKERFISKTRAAQVIGSSGSEQSRSVYIDKGSRDGIETDQAVITADGIVGKVLRVFDSSSLVLLINDQTSGVGVILDKSRLQGVLRGTASGAVRVEKILSDETVPVGEQILTSGGDQIFPKGLPVGTVSAVKTGTDSFLEIHVKPTANLSKLEEVLVVTRIEEKSPSPGEMTGPVRAVDILTQRLPSVPDKPATDTKNPAGTAPAQPSAVGAVRSGPNAGLATPKASARQAAAPQPSGSPIGTPKISQATGTTGVVKPGNGSTVPKPTTSAPLIATPKTIPGVTNSGATKPVNGAAAGAKPTAPAGKPAGTAGAAAGTVNPAVAPKPVPAANTTADKSAKPTPTQPKPDQAPPEDNPQ